MHIPLLGQPSVLSQCWLGVMKSIQPIKSGVMRCWLSPPPTKKTLVLAPDVC